MGYFSALDMASQTDLTTALHWHLASNNFPPVPTRCVPVAKRAIRYAKRAEWDRLLRLPAGVEWRGKSRAPVSACVNAWHLQAFLE